MSIELKKVDVICADGQSLAEGWMVTPLPKGGKEMLELVRGHYRVKKFVSGDYTMYDHLRRCRDRAVEKEMKRKCHEVELSDEQIAGVGLPKRPKRQMIDEIAEVIEIEVTLEDDSVVQVSVGSAFSEQQNLFIEYTKDNLELLLKAPKPEEVPVAVAKFVPVVAEVNVGWNKQARGVYCRYYDQASKQHKRKTMSVKLKGDAADMQEQVNKLAKVCQLFYDEHHTDPDEVSSQEG